jgi:hypothetical protein
MKTLALKEQLMAHQRLFLRLFAASAALLWPFSAKAASLTAAEASGHVGETATVCG